MYVQHDGMVLCSVQWIHCVPYIKQYTIFRKSNMFITWTVKVRARVVGNFAINTGKIEWSLSHVCTKQRICNSVECVNSATLYLRDGRTDGRTDSNGVRPSVRPFVCLFVRCVCHGRPSYGGGNKPQCFNLKKIKFKKFKGRGIKSGIN